MGVEAAGYIADLNPLWPLATDGVNAGDDHFRNFKKSVQDTWPLLDGPVNLTPDQLNALANVSGRNHIHNAAMQVAQRGTSFTAATTFLNNDDAYTLDRWFILSDGNDIVDVTQSTEAPADGVYSIALDVETVNKKFGIAQIIEQKDCAGLFGQSVTLSFKAKVSATTKLDNLKAAIISWSGSADVVTSDVISSWNAEGTAPNLIANATYENTPVNLNPTTSWATYSVTGPVDTASAKNIMVFIWSDVTDTTLGDFLYITDVQLEKGTIATPIERRPFSAELDICQRCLPVSDQFYLDGQCYGTNSAYFSPSFRVKARIAPTAIALTASVGSYNVTNSAFANQVCNSITFGSANVGGGAFPAVVNGTPLVAGNAAKLVLGTNPILWTGAEL